MKVVRNGADVNAVNEENGTSLGIAAQSESCLCLKCFVGAEIELKAIDVVKLINGPTKLLKTLRASRAGEGTNVVRRDGLRESVCNTPASSRYSY